MNRKTYATPYGEIVYWTNEFEPGLATIVFLPGLTATHILFDKQVEYFEERCNCLVWDAPGHGESWPFALEFSLDDKARWLRGIFAMEGIVRPLVVGQSMGGYVAQCFMELFPGELGGFICIDSAPLQRKYVKDYEVNLMRKTEGMYRAYPWKSLVKAGVKGCAETEYGREIMKRIIDGYDREHYLQLTAHGYRILADAYDSRRSYFIDCPVTLVCGERDKAGSSRKLSERWTVEEEIPLYWIAKAGHNSNTDDPQRVNEIIEGFIEGTTQMRLPRA